MGLLSTEVGDHSGIVGTAGFHNTFFLCCRTKSELKLRLIHKCRHNGRVVKASDLKSDGLCPRRFKSCLCRFAQYAQDNITSVIGSVVEYNVANVVARVRFPDDA